MTSIHEKKNDLKHCPITDSADVELALIGIEVIGCRPVTILKHEPILCLIIFPYSIAGFIAIYRAQYPFCISHYIPAFHFSLLKIF